MEALPKTKRSRSSSSASGDSAVIPNVRPRLDADGGDDLHPTQPTTEDPEPTECPPVPNSPQECGSKGRAPSAEKSDTHGDEPCNATAPEAESNEPEASYPAAASSSTAVFSNGDWQAVYDPSQSAYYFVNSCTGETTWTNPFTSSSSSVSEPAQEAITAPADLGGIDPELAYLDPKCAREMSSRGGQHPPTFTARFNSRTGKFESDPTQDPSRVSQYARARTQAGAYFDVDGWEKSLEQSNGRITGTSRDRQAEAIKNGQRLSKAELARFKEKKMEKKSQRQRAWLAG